jgi:hypothetical protein
MMNVAKMSKMNPMMIPGIPASDPSSVDKHHRGYDAGDHFEFGPDGFLDGQKNQWRDQDEDAEGGIK